MIWMVKRKSRGNIIKQGKDSGKFYKADNKPGPGATGKQIEKLK